MFKNVSIFLAVSVIFLSLFATPVNAVQVANMNNDQRAMLAQYGIDASGVVIDSAMTRDEALGDHVVPAEGRAVHAAMKPMLRVVPVVYHGFDERIHVGQIVVHKALVIDTIKTFWKMFELGFPIEKVIPQSKFGYNDQASMAANNTSNYRPDDGSEHGRGAAFDINPFQNPFDLTAYDGRPIEPAGSTYDIAAKGTILKDSPLRKYWTSLDYEWGGGWGDRNATPITDFFRENYYDYQHFQLNYKRYDSFVATLPVCMQTWTCVE